MSKRIAYLDLKTGVPREAPVPARLVSAGHSVEIVETRIRVTPVDAVDLLLADTAYAEAAMRAESEGFDGVMIGGVPDYGLAAAQAAVRIPVVGSGQASLLAAAALGGKFGIVTIWPETMAFVYDRLLRENPIGRQCVSVRYVSTPAEQSTLADDDNFLTQMKSGREHMIERILAEIALAVADGATSIVLGCNCMRPVADVLAARAGVPIIDPTSVAYRQVESMITLGLRPARDPRVPLSERQELLAQMLETAGDAMSAEPEECPVCVLGDDGVASCSLPVPADA